MSGPSRDDRMELEQLVRTTEADRLTGADRVPPSRLRELERQVAPRLAGALKLALRNARSFHRRGRVRSFRRRGRDGSYVGQRSIGMASVGLALSEDAALTELIEYGSAVAAAGVRRISVVVPPASLRGPVALALRRLRVDDVYLGGGAGAAVTLARGEGDVDTVEMLAGPGDGEWRAAKGVLGRTEVVAIDGVAERRKLVLVVDRDSPIRELWDEVQAFPAGEPILISIGDPVELGSTSKPEIRVVSDEAQAVRAVDELAPTLVLVATSSAEGVARRIRTAACVHIGAATSPALGLLGAGVPAVEVVRADGARALVTPALFSRPQTLVRYCRTRAERTADPVAELRRST